MTRCPACGAENKPSTKFCHDCGANLSAQATPGETATDSDRTVLLPPQPTRTPGTIEQAMRMSPDSRKSGERPLPTPPDNEMTVILPKKSAPPPKYEPAPPTVTGPLTEPIPHGKSSKTSAGKGKSSAPATVKKPKTPLAVVLALLVVAGGSAGYLGWLILKKNKVAAPAEKVAVAPPAVESVQPPPPKAVAPVQPPPAPPTPSAPSAAPAPATASAVVAPPPVAPPEIAAAPPPLPKPVAQIVSKPVPAPPAEAPKPDTSKAEKAKAEQMKKEQARLEAAKKEKQKKAAAGAPPATNTPVRPAESPRSSTPAAVEPARQEPTPLALLRDELRACDAQSVFTRESCKNQARQRRCAGLWDRIPECPYKKELY